MKPARKYPPPKDPRVELHVLYRHGHQGAHSRAFVDYLSLCWWLVQVKENPQEDKSFPSSGGGSLGQTLGQIEAQSACGKSLEQGPDG